MAFVGARRTMLSTGPVVAGAPPGPAIEGASVTLAQTGAEAFAPSSLATAPVGNSYTVTVPATKVGFRYIA